LRATLRRTVLLLLTCLAAACATTGLREAWETEQLFTVVYRDIRDVYFFHRDTSELALAGLSNLARVDQRIAVVENGGAVTLSVAGEPVESFNAPNSADSEGWGELTAAFIEVASVRSDLLEEAGIAGVQDIVLAGIFDQLDEPSRYFRFAPELETGVGDEAPMAGIGVSLGQHPDGARVFFVNDDAPARKAGLRRGDIIELVDGWPLNGLAPREILQTLGGPVGSKVHLTIKRKDLAEPLTVTVVRQNFDQGTVNYRRLDDVAYFQIDLFAQGTAAALGQKMDAARLGEDDSLRGAIIDLRSNPGGDLREGVRVANLFVRSGLIAETQGRHRLSHRKFFASARQRAQGRPLVLLINGSTNGVAEMVAVALQDHDRAVVVGSVSDGGGAIQTVLSLPNRDTIELTWAMLRAPSGYAWYERGVLPDICTNGGSLGVDGVLDRLRGGRLPLAAALQQRPVDPRDDTDVEALRAHCPAHYEEDDIDLAVARRLLQDPELFELALGDRQL